MFSPDPILHIHQNPRARDRYQRSSGEGLLLHHHLTFRALWDRVGQMAPKGDHLYATPTMSCLATWAAMASLDAWAERRHGALLRQAQSGLERLHAAGLRPMHLVSAGASAELVSLLECYERILLRNGLESPGTTLRSTLTALQRRVPAWLDDVQEVDVEPQAWISESELELCSALATSERRVTLRLAWDPDRPHLFSWTEGVIDYLQKRQPNIRIRYDRRTGDGPLAALRAAQFGGRPHVSVAAEVAIHHASNLREQLRWCAQEIGRWTHAGVAQDDIAVVCPQPALVSAALASTLSEMGLALESRQDVALSVSPAAQVLLAILRREPEGAVQDLLDLWVNTTESVDVPDGPWSTTRAAGLVRRSGAYSARLWPPAEAFLAQATKKHGAQELDVRRARAIARELRRFAERVSVPQEPAPLWQHVDLVASLLSLLPGSDKRMVAWALDAIHEDGLWHVGLAQQALIRVAQLLADLRFSARALDLPPVTSEDAALLIEHLLSREQLSLRPQRAGTIALLSPAQVVGCRFACVCLLGFDSQTFPAATPAGGVLDEHTLRRLNDRLGHKFVVPPPVSLLGHGAWARDFWLWMETLAAAQQTLSITTSRPPADTEGHSVVIDELLRCVEPSEESAPHSFSPGDLLYRMVEADADTRAHPDARRGDFCHRRMLRPSTNVDGVLVRQLLEKCLLSPSALESLGVCGFQFFARALLRLSPDEAPGLELDMRDEGTLAHAALYSVYHDVIAHGGLTAGRSEPALVLARARTVFEKERAELLGPVHIHPLLEDAALEQAWRAVERQLLWDIEHSHLQEPLALEYRFGDRQDAQAKPLELTLACTPDLHLSVRGAIDRIDRGDQSVVVLDYKRSRKVRHVGRHFQLPLYGALAWRDFGAGRELLRGGWRNLKPDDREHDALDASENPELFVRTLHAELEARLAPLLRGEVRTDPDPADSCRVCDFRPLCRYAATNE